MREAYRYIQFFSSEKTSPHIKLVEITILPCKIRIRNTGPSTLRWYECWASCFSLESAGKELKNACLWDICIDLKGWNAGHYLFRWKNTKLCMLFSSDQTKKIPKNVFHVWLSELNCCISHIKWWGRNTTIVRAETILFITNFKIEVLKIIFMYK